MKEKIHPAYYEVLVQCACGERFVTGTTKKCPEGVLKVDICSICHPFFTGKQKFVDNSGRIEKFNNRYNRK